ncbi:LemA family protein [uncultured Croceitalea sp.]|uniref:LemA family protein n=1 Tax=uncultured Croceitalea sp. TaxID=1798908 RepID=UPI0033064CE8
MKKKFLGLGCLGIGIIAIIVIAVGGIVFYVNTNNTLVDMKGQATKQWANVESSYQRRSDLIGNLVKTVQGAADFERGTLKDVIEARSKATSTTIDANNLTPEKLAAFQQAQSGLSSALSRLLVTVERYPDLKSNQNFLELQSQLEGTENRINVERNRFNDLAGEYNIKIEKIPTNFIANIAGFEGMALFSSKPGAEDAPDVDFNFD